MSDEQKGTNKKPKGLLNLPNGEHDFNDLFALPTSSSKENGQFATYFSKMKIDGREYEIKTIHNLAYKIFSDIWYTARSAFEKWRDSAEDGDFRNIIREKSQIPATTFGKARTIPLSDGYCYYWNMFPRYHAEAARLLLESCGLKEKCKVTIARSPSSAAPDITEEMNTNIDTALEPIFKKIDDALAHKKQVILYGPPGTGKTFTARRYVANRTAAQYQKIETENDQDKSNTRKEEPHFCEYCTFHPEYGHEHFIEGLCNDENKNFTSFITKSGILKEYAKLAIADPAYNYYFIIDEINRGDIPRIFGEIISLLDADKRNEDSSVRLPLSGEEFYLPPNLYFIGTMNTADRSISLLDSALRRRFAFIEMKPEYYHFTDIKMDTLCSIKEQDTTLADWFMQLNAKIIETLTGRHDVADLQIGHSYFFPIDQLNKERFRQIITYEILPLLKEYCYEDEGSYEKLKEFIAIRTRIDIDKDTTAVAENEPHSEMPDQENAASTTDVTGNQNQ